MHGSYGESMNENILLINVHSSRNLGDAALLQAAQQQLQQKFPGSQFTLCMDDPISHTGDGVALQSISAWVHPMGENGEPQWNLLRLAWLLPASCLPVWSWRLIGKAIFWITPRSLRRIIQAYLHADIVVSKPGGFLFSSGREISLLVALYSITLAIMAGKLVYILPQSIAPLRYYLTAPMVSWVLKRHP